MKFLGNFSGITNYEEYSVIQEVTEDKKEDGMGTLRKDRTLLLRDERKMEKLKAKLHTDDDCECKLCKSLIDACMDPLGSRSYFLFSQHHYLDVLYHSRLIYCSDV